MVITVIDFIDFIDGCRSYMSLISDINFVFKRRLIAISVGWTRFAKHDGAIDRFELSCNEPSYCADLEEPKQIELQELEITKMEVSPILVV